MPIESATYISDLVSTNPPGTDDRSTSDDHHRLTKAVLKATFPNASAAINPSVAEFNYLVGVTSLIQTQFAAKAALGANSDITSLSALSTPLTVAQGGIGVATLTSNGVVIGNGIGGVTVTAEGTTGTVLSGVTGADPVWVANTVDAGSLTHSATMLNFGDESDGAITHSTTTTITNGIYQCTDFEIENAVIMTFASFGIPLVIMCTGTCTITGELNAKGKGADASTTINSVFNEPIVFGGSGGGGGGDADNTNGRAGAGTFQTAGGAGSTSFSGPGGAGSALNTNVADMLDTFSLPTFPWAGGGGGGGGGDNGSNGGDGGGTIIIIADTINFTGTINIGGNAGGSSTTGNGGGGGGGLLWMAANTWTADTGTRTSGGGSGGTGGSSRNGGTGGAGTVVTITF